MKLDAKSSDAHTVMVAIVRDKDGNPKFDDPDNVPDVVLKALTPKDLDYLEKLREE